MGHCISVLWEVGSSQATAGFTEGNDFYTTARIPHSVAMLLGDYGVVKVLSQREYVFQAMRIGNLKMSAG